VTTSAPGSSDSIPIEIDLGELVRGHHVVLRSLTVNRVREIKRWQYEAEERHRLWLEQFVRDGGGQSFQTEIRRPAWTGRDHEIVERRPLEPELEYEFTPGLRPEEDQQDHFFWYWMMKTSDDLGSVYRDDNSGGRGPAIGGDATRGTRDICGFIPPGAHWLFLDFSPTGDWVLHEAVQDYVEIDVWGRIAPLEL
jgi:hypothetical protein